MLIHIMKRQCFLQHCCHGNLGTWKKVAGFQGAAERARALQEQLLGCTDGFMVVGGSKVLISSLKANGNEK